MSFIAPMIIGFVDADGCVNQLAGDVESVLGFQPSECIGTQGLDYVHRDDRTLIAGGAASERVELRLQRRSGEWLKTEIVLAPLHPTDSGHLAFAITIPAGTERMGAAGRVASLEARLRRIAAEVAAAGIDGWTSTSALRHDVVDVLSPRQAEIAERLAAGKRVPTIANETGLSQSTVRNHLSQIFQKFGVASQAELIEVLHGDSDQQKGHVG